jgi:hypothetical protein
VLQAFRAVIEQPNLLRGPQPAELVAGGAQLVDQLGRRRNG